MTHASAFSLTTRSYSRSMAYAFDARGSFDVPSAMRETVPCDMPVASWMADCVHPIEINAEIFSDVFIGQTIRKRIENVNTKAHYLCVHNFGMELKDWLQAEMDKLGIGPSELARMSKVPQPTIFRILSSETKDPRTGTVKKLERALGVQSPRLEAPAQYQELITAWELLSQKQRQDFLVKIKAMADDNEEIRADAKPKTVAKPPPKMPDTHRPADRRHGLSFFGGPDRRQDKKNDTEK